MNSLETRNELVEKYRSIVPPLAKLIGGNSGVDLADIVSAGYVGLIAGCGSVDTTLPPSEIKWYVSAVARNEMVRQIRSERKGGIIRAPARQAVVFVPAEDAENVPVDGTFFDDSVRTRIMRLKAGPLRAVFLCLLTEPYATKSQIAKALSRGFKKTFTKNDVDYLIRMGRRQLQGARR